MFEFGTHGGGMDGGSPCRMSIRDWSLITGRGGATKWENRGSETFCAPPSRQGKTFRAPPFKERKLFVLPLQYD